jgi:hypothetical protein
MAYRIVVTEVTLYGPLLRCVAGFDLDREVMVRPEPEPEGFWEARFCGANTTFHPGHLVRFEGERPDTALPHNTEDLVVRGKPRETGKLTEQDFKQALRAAEALSPDKVFGAHLKFESGKAYVPAGAACGSLAGQTIDAETLRLFDDVYGEGHRLRAKMSVGGHVLNLSVTAKNLKQAFRGQGLPAAQALVPRGGPIHVRLGLARPFKDHPDRCYLQINGLLAL